jgi:1-acyl-sn-glycerol-3-phosphate acyltransferase
MASALQRIRSLAFTGLWAVWTAFFLPVLFVIRLAGSPERWVRSASRVWAQGVLLGLRWIVGLTYVEHGRENIPNEPSLIIANHQSTWETIAFLLLFRDVAIVTKQELLEVPIFGWFLRRSPMILIDRESGSKAIRKMAEEGAVALSKGRSVLIFPEGTRSDPFAPVEFKRGVELLYSKLDRAVLPVAVNSGHFWGSGQMNKRSGAIRVSYLDPIPPKMPPRVAMKQAEQAIQAELNRLQGDAPECARSSRQQA